ncbi:hypothetical protein [Blastococcus brunescens]|uniref:Uncharacterized protein n=1 Tax=Blastococcus brunescens TaxID=1564165 RepID=A0ABZ1B4C9_9ACTN|nr:hypothetical protein [Blastococcus sp. BMG 8361]WRL65016.1 hypothetical protein U6N30_04710 [Blastococcus sp. BMG 8361]
MLICLILPLAGCAGVADAGPGTRSADVAVPSYRPTPDAPDYCDALAGSTHLAGVPAAVGVLAAERGDVEAELELTAAIDELRLIGDGVSDQGGSPRLRAAVDDLVDALNSARDDGVTTSVREVVSAALDDVGRLVQPACRFPS